MTLTVHPPLEFEVLATGLGFPEGPVLADDGTAYVVDIDSGGVIRVADGTTTVVATPGGGPNGMAPETADTMLIANNGGFLWSEVNGVRIPIDFATHTNVPPDFRGGWIERVTLSTGEVEVLHRECNGRRLCGPNDLVIDEVGGVWFTDHGKGRHDSIDRGGLYYIPPGLAVVQEIAFPLLGANGVGLSPDGTRVYVAETYTGRLWAWDLAAPGVVKPAPAVAGIRHGGFCLAATAFSFDSMAIETDGRIVIGAVGDGIAVVTPDGKEIDQYPIPGDVTTNIAFGGRDGCRAIVTLSRSGRLVETTWPRTGLVVGPH